MIKSISRRAFFQVSASVGGGLVLGFYLPGIHSANASSATEKIFEPNAFIKISRSGVVSIVIPVPEVGQGVRTSLAMIVAEELNVDWSMVRVEQADADPRFGGMAAAGSDSVADYFKPLRRAGAMAREMLIAAAAVEWNVKKDGCTARQGVVIHDATGRKVLYGSLVGVASAMPVPGEVTLKAPKDFDIIGQRIPRIDLSEMLNGSALYGLDVKIPGMLYAVVERCPVFGGKLLSFNAEKTRAVAGVLDVFEIQPVLIADEAYGEVQSGVAVIADNTWAAMQGRKALTVQWDCESNSDENSASLREKFKRLKSEPGRYVLRNKGDAKGATKHAAVCLEADYELPFLAHACMEPMNFTADIRKNSCEVWGPTQHPRMLQRMLSVGLNIPGKAVKVHPTLVGGAFGRRLAVDYGIEAAMVSRIAKSPVKVVWTREDDIQHDYYRTANYHRLRAALDKNKKPIAWHHLILSKSLSGHDSEQPAIYEVQGAADLPFDFEHILVEYTPVKSGIRVGSWRSVSHSYNSFVINSFIDEIAAAAGMDPYEFHVQYLSAARELKLTLPLRGRRGRPSFDMQRLRGVLDTVAKEAGWGKTLPKRWGMGIACVRYKNTYVAHVAEVSVTSGKVNVQRVVAAIDCGTVINPDGLEAQVEGAILDGLGTVFNWEVTIEKGRIQQSNFHDYSVTRIDEVPDIDVYIVPTNHPPSGAGEPPYPSVAAAITNAIFAATGTRIRRLPIQPGDFG